MTVETQPRQARPAAPATSQSHGTLLLLVVAGFVVLAFLLWLSVRHVGPFQARILDTVPRDGGAIGVTVELANEGDRAGHARCALGLVDAATGDRRQDFQFLSRRIPGNTTITQLVVVPGGDRVRTAGTISC